MFASGASAGHKKKSQKESTLIFMTRAITVVQGRMIEHPLHTLPIALAMPIPKLRKKMKPARKVRVTHYTSSESSSDVTYDFGGDFRDPLCFLARVTDASDSVSSRKETSEFESSSNGAC
tara:strand:+ start:310 stop:669 length:360 start_codon:yes stop_codon:yes gene_type:complete